MYILYYREKFKYFSLKLLAYRYLTEIQILIYILFLYSTNSVFIVIVTYFLYTINMYDILFYFVHVLHDRIVRSFLIFLLSFIYQYDIISFHFYNSYLFFFVSTLIQ